MDHIHHTRHDRLPVCLIHRYARSLHTTDRQIIDAMNNRGHKALAFICQHHCRLCQLQRGGQHIPLSDPGTNGFTRVPGLAQCGAFPISAGQNAVLLTGGISLLELDAKYIAIKEAAIPGLLGLATLGSLYTRWPLVRTLLYNDRILDTAKIARALEGRGNLTAFDRALQHASWMIAGSFFLSSALNYILAKVLLQSPPGTEAFNAELGKMTALSFPVIALPATIILMAALFFLFHRIGKLTGLKLEEVIVVQ